MNFIYVKTDIYKVVVLPTQLLLSSIHSSEWQFGYFEEKQKIKQITKFPILRRVQVNTPNSPSPGRGGLGTSYSKLGVS